MQILGRLLWGRVTRSTLVALPTWGLWGASKPIVATSKKLILGIPFRGPGPLKAHPAYITAPRDFRVYCDAFHSHPLHHILIGIYYRCHCQ